MQLTREQLQTYKDQGYLFLPNVFSQAEVNVMKAELPSIYETKDTPRKVIEEDSKTLRTVLGLHIENKVFQSCSRHPRIVKPIMQILGSKVYVHQCQINPKVAFAGDVWPWHQDYAFYRKEDGIPTPRLVIAIIFLDEVNEFNGPLMIVPGSHQEGLISVLNEKKQHITYQNSWESDRYNTTNFTHIVDKETLAKLVRQYGIAAPKGAAGSVILLHPSCVHGSTSNLYPFDRVVLVIRYNSVENIPVAVEKPRPEFLASRNYQAIEPLSDDVFLSVNAN
jgi:ectoine hydroxylase